MASSNGAEMQTSPPRTPRLIEVASLPQKHPTGDTLLELFGAQVVSKPKRKT
jgi:hypothetical protein